MIGQLLRATLLNLKEERERLGRQLGDVAGVWRDDEAVVAELACRALVRQNFGQDTSFARIAAFAAAIGSRLNNEDIPTELVERVLRRALGEPESILEGVTSRKRFAVRTIVLVQLVKDLGLKEISINELVLRCERIAFDQGFKPYVAA